MVYEKPNKELPQMQRKDMDKQPSYSTRRIRKINPRKICQGHQTCHTQRGGGSVHRLLLFKSKFIMKKPEM